MKVEGAGESARSLLQQLSHVETRSGASIADAMGVSRTAVWKHVKTLRQMGIVVDAVAGQGYRLREPVELLEPGIIRKQLGDVATALIRHLHVLGTVDSTNDRLQALDSDSRHASAVLAEMQLSGRGRRGQPWVSPFARNIYLSLGWRFEAGVASLGCLPLVVAIAACEALERSGVGGVRIKWPNDLLLDGAKLGGCLVEVQGDAAGPCLAIVGIGINVRMGPGLADEIDQPWTDAASANPGVSRNLLAGSLVDALLARINQFAENGFDSFHDAWEARDALQGRAVVVSSASFKAEGLALGISRAGGLRLQSASGVAEYTSGEVSIRQKDL